MPSLWCLTGYRVFKCSLTCKKWRKIFKWKITFCDPIRKSIFCSLFLFLFLKENNSQLWLGEKEHSTAYRGEVVTRNLNCTLLLTLSLSLSFFLSFFSLCAKMEVMVPPFLPSFSPVCAYILKGKLARTVQSCTVHTGVQSTHAILTGVTTNIKFWSRYNIIITITVIYKSKFFIIFTKMILYYGEPFCSIIGSEWVLQMK